MYKIRNNLNEKKWRAAKNNKMLPTNSNNMTISDTLTFYMFHYLITRELRFSFEAYKCARIVVYTQRHNIRVARKLYTFISRHSNISEKTQVFLCAYKIQMCKIHTVRGGGGGKNNMLSDNLFNTTFFFATYLNLFFFLTCFEMV